jgi:NAD(P)-dependent dehydrogenase (short-subunit alcohol dehydrogenase family)
MTGRYDGKVAFITGAASGFGWAFAEALSNAGAAVALADIDVDGARRRAAQIAAPATPVIGVACDVADDQSVERAVAQTVEQLGGVDILINNAARHLKKYNRPFSALTRQEIRGLFDVNLMGIINCSLACKPSISQRGGGAIVNMSSAGGYVSSTPYGVTKLAVRGLTIAFATEFSSAGIRVNAIAPTIIATDGVRSEYADEEIDQLVKRRQLVPRRGQLEDVTNTMLFLCSEEASFITGETIRVTGGASLSI